MNLTIDQVRAAAAVGSTGSFTDAATTLGVSQPAVTRTIHALENTLGTRLFTRTTRSVSPTADGARFLVVADEILESYDNGLRRFGAFLRADSGSLTIVALPSLAVSLVPSALASFLSSRPEVDVRVLTAAAGDLIAHLHRGYADVGVTEAPSERMGVHVDSLGTDDLVAVVPAGHLLSARRTLTWAELATQPFVQLSAGTSVRRMADRAFAQAGAVPVSAVEADAIGTAAALVAQGLGVSVFPMSTLPLVGRAGLDPIPLTSPTATRELAIVTATTPYPSSLARAFVRAVRDARRAQEPR